MAHNIIIDSGEIFNFNPTTSVSFFYDQIFISNKDKDFAFFLNSDRSLKMEDAKLLEEKNLGCIDGKALFDLPELSYSIFNWKNEAELSFIKSFINEKSRALDCGCGFGRLLYPLNEQGLKVDGIDISYSSILFLKNKLESRNINTGLYCCSIDNFINPDYYDFAFSALNTVRYLQCISSIKRHFICIAKSLKKGGIYVFNTSVTDNENLEYNISWNFYYGEKEYTIEWNKIEHNYFSNTLTDFVQILDKSNGIPLLSEEQIQFIFTGSILNQIFKEMSNLFCLTQIYDTQFSALGVKKIPLKGNFWFQLERR